MSDPAETPPTPGPANIADPIILPMPAGQEATTIRSWVLALQAGKTVPIRSEQERQALLRLLEHAIPQGGLTLAMLHRLQGKVAAARKCSVLALNSCPVTAFVAEALALVEEPATVEVEPAPPVREDQIRLRSGEVVSVPDLAALESRLLRALLDSEGRPGAWIGNETLIRLVYRGRQEPADPVKALDHVRGRLQLKINRVAPTLFIEQERGRRRLLE